MNEDKNENRGSDDRCSDALDVAVIVGQLSHVASLAGVAIQALIDLQQRLPAFSAERLDDTIVSAGGG
jgi:hypothetical protein